jgi:Flp pilus assembly protein TadG
MIVDVRGERGGSASVEAAVLAVVFGLLIAFAIAAGRLVAAEAATDHAARSAARLASLQRDAATASTVAHDAAALSLAEQGLHCTSIDIAVDTSGFARPFGTAASVNATVRCTISWADLGLPGAPGTHVVDSTFASPLDTWRERIR